MLKFLRAIVPLCLFAMGGNAVAEVVVQQLPDISGYTLEGERLSLPADLSAPATLIVIVEDDPFAEDLVSWREVSSQLDGEVPALFLVTMGDKRGLSRSMAAGRLRADVSDPAFREILVPVFQDGGELRGGLGIASNSRVSVVLVNPSGEVIWRARGPAGDATIDELRSSLRAPLKQTRIADEPPVTNPAQADVAAPEVQTLPAPKPLRMPAALNVEVPTALPPKMPEIDGVTLAGRNLSMPGDLSKSGTRLILVPYHAGHDVLVAALSEAELAGAENASDWYVLLFMGKSPRFGKAVAAGQLRSKIESSVWRAHVLPVYMELSSFDRLAGLGLGVGTRAVMATPDGALSTLID